MPRPSTEFDWDDLRYFLAVARAGSLTGAAKALRVNHSTVYRRVGGFEDAIGARLFERLPRGYDLTAAGEELLPIATRVEEDMLTLGRRVAGHDAGLQGRVVLTTVDELVLLLAPRLVAFHRTFPGIQLEVRGEQRVVSLTRREADVALRPGGRPDEPDVVARRLCALPSGLYASRGYLTERGGAERGAAERGGAIDANDLTGHALVTVDASLEHTPLYSEIVGRARDPQVVFRGNDMLGLLAAARAGFGVTLLPCFLGDSEPDLVRLGEPLFRETSGLWLLVHADLRQTARVRAFVDFLAEAVTAEADLFEGRGANRPSAPGPASPASRPRPRAVLRRRS